MDDIGELNRRLQLEIAGRKQAEESKKASDARLESLLRIAQHQVAGVPELLDFALNECITLTASTLGYIYLYDEGRQEFVLNTWSKEVMKECSVMAPETIYQLDKTGIWGDAVRFRKPIVINDFKRPDPRKKGYPEGHVALSRFLTIPVLSDNRIVAVVGVANKGSDYDAADITQLTLLMDAVWKITDRIRAKTALQEKSEMLDQFFNISLDLLCIADNEGHFVMLNRAWEKLLGYTREELMAKKFLEFVHPDDIGMTLVAIQQLADQRDVQGFINRYRCKDGSYRWIEWRTAPAGKMIYAAARDISERKRTEMELQKLASVVKNSSELVTLADMDGRMIFINEAGGRMIGIAPGLVGRYGADEIIAPACRTLLKTEIVPAIMQNGSWKGDLQYCHIETGKLIDVHAMTFLIIDFETSDPLCLATVALDITERKRMESSLRESKEAAESATRAKSIFLANMSHEIRTPLNAIIGFGELLAGLKLDEKQRSFVEPIRTAGRSLLRLLNDLLDLSKIEAGRMELHLSPVDLRLLLEEVEVIFAPRILQKGLKFSVEIDPDLPQELMLDEIRLRQVLVNVVGNAIKFTDQGSVHVGVAKRFTRPDESQMELEIAVQDSGVGIPLAAQEQIFGAFRQQSEQNTAKYGGTGLGLTISRRLVEMMSGSITLQSKVGKGSTFSLKFPHVSVAATNQLSRMVLQDDRPEVSSFKFNGQRVLIVDDVESNRVMLRALLEQVGLRVVEAQDGPSSITLAAESLPALIIMDIRMPGMSGFQATAQLKKQPSTSAIPVIALTASTMEFDSPAVLQAGFERYLVKPLASTVLLREIERVLGGDVREGPAATEKSGEPEWIDDAGSTAIPKAVRDGLLTVACAMQHGIVVSRARAFVDQMLEVSEHYEAPTLAVLAQQLAKSADRLDVIQMKHVLHQISRWLTGPVDIVER